MIAGRRPWTRLGTLAIGAHLLYELASGVAVPLASRVGVGPAASLYSAMTALCLREAGRRPQSQDTVFAVVNGAYLSAVIGHFTTWPRTTVAGLPWLTECEGLHGRLMPAYNAILYVSGVAAVAGLVENRRGAVTGALVPALLVPVLVRAAPREYERLILQARRRPRWWNRRLQGG